MKPLQYVKQLMYKVYKPYIVAIFKHLYKFHIAI